MVDRELLADRLQRLRSYREALRQWEHCDREALEDLIFRSAAERLLQLSAQVMIDLGAHVVAARGLGSPEDYRSVFRLMRRAGLLEEDLALRLDGWAGFRNVLVHLYADVRADQLHHTLTRELGDLDDFVEALGPLLR